MLGFSSPGSLGVMHVQLCQKANDPKRPAAGQKYTFIGVLII